MFFKNITNWSLRRLRVNWVLWQFIYLCFSLIAPAVIISAKYHLFDAPTKKSLNGFTIILILIFGILGLRALRKAISKLPEVTHKQQCFKYPMQMLYVLIYPLLFIVISSTYVDNCKLAFNTFTLCAIMIAISIVIDYLAVKFLDAEMDIRNKAREQLEINTRIEKGVC